MAQITLGAVLLLGSIGTGSFFCSALISEGISDMIFGIEGLVKGHCNWSQYWDNKKMSLAITVATAGVGALFARGKEASKYAYKAFGNASKLVMKQTAKITGKSVNKIMVKEVAKCIGKKVGGAVIDAGISVALDKIMTQFSQTIDSISASIIDWFYKILCEDDLRKKIEEFLQQQEDLQNAGKRLHETIMCALQPTFLELWDTLEHNAKRGVDVVTQGHGQAASHLRMCGEKLKGRTVMKYIGYISRFAPLVTEMLKAGIIPIKMIKVKDAIVHDLEQQCTNDKHKQSQSDETIKEIQDIIDQEISATKHYLSQEMSQRGQTIVKTGLHILSQEARKRTIKFGTECVVHPLLEHIDLNQLMKYEQKLKAAKSDQSDSQIKKYKRKLEKLMKRTCSPKVFAHLIEHHDAQLGPAFAVPALETLVKRPIRIVTGDGKELLNVAHHADGEPIEITFIPEKGDAPGHYIFGEKEFTPQQDGNNCLIHAVLAGAGGLEMDAGQVRKDIAKACYNQKHPCHDYIKYGIARNYVRIGMVGAGYDHNSNKFDSKKAYWHADIKACATLELGMHSPGIDPKETHLCHRVSEQSIKDMVEDDIRKDCSKVKVMLKYFYPLPHEVRDNKESSLLDGQSREAFLRMYGHDGPCKKRYLKRREDTVKCVKRWNEATSDRGKYRGTFNRLIKDLSNSPINVSRGDPTRNRRTGKYMDYQCGEPRSERLLKIFKPFEKCGFYRPKFTTGSFHYDDSSL